MFCTVIFSSLLYSSHHFSSSPFPFLLSSLLLFFLLHFSAPLFSSFVSSDLGERGHSQEPSDHAQLHHKCWPHHRSVGFSSSLSHLDLPYFFMSWLSSPSWILEEHARCIHPVTVHCIKSHHNTSFDRYLTSIPQFSRHDYHSLSRLTGSVFWSTLVSWVNSFARLDSLPEEQQNYLSVVILLMFLLILPFIFDTLARNYEGMKLESEIQNAIMSRYELIVQIFDRIDFSLGIATTRIGSITRSLWISLYLSHTHTHTLSLSLTHTHTHTPHTQQHAYAPISESATCIDTHAYRMQTYRLM